MTTIFTRIRRWADVWLMEAFVIAAMAASLLAYLLNA